MNELTEQRKRIVQGLHDALEGSLAGKGVQSYTLNDGTTATGSEYMNPLQLMQALELTRHWNLASDAIIGNEPIKEICELAKYAKMKVT